jgi:hypothetical protein
MKKNNEIIKTKYMDSPQRGYSEYFFRTEDARKATSPVPGDRCFMKDGSLWFCWDVGFWTKIGDPVGGETEVEETILLDLNAEFAYSEDMGGYVANVTADNPFEVWGFYTLSIDGTPYRAMYIDDDADSIYCIDGEADSGFVAYYGLMQEGAWTMASLVELVGEHQITISTRSDETNYWFGITNCENYHTDTGDIRAMYQSNLLIRTNDFDFGSEGGSPLSIVVTNEEGTEIYNGQQNLSTDYAKPYKGTAYISLSDDYSLYNMAKNGETITVKISQIINGNTVEKTYGGTSYAFMSTCEFISNYDEEFYSWGNDFKSVSESIEQGGN